VIAKLTGSRSPPTITEIQRRIDMLRLFPIELTCRSYPKLKIALALPVLFLHTGILAASGLPEATNPYVRGTPDPPFTVQSSAKTFASLDNKKKLGVPRSSRSLA
jgi:hypothetical protein